MSAGARAMTRARAVCIFCRSEVEASRIRCPECGAARRRFMRRSLRGIPLYSLFTTATVATLLLSAGVLFAIRDTGRGPANAFGRLRAAGAHDCVAVREQLTGPASEAYSSDEKLCSAVGVVRWSETELVFVDFDDEETAYVCVSEPPLSAFRAQRGSGGWKFSSPLPGGWAGCASGAVPAG